MTPLDEGWHVMEWSQGERDAIAAMKIDEATLLVALHLLRLSPRDGGRRIGVNYKRVVRWCCKWEDHDWYEWGVAPDLGWLTERGHAAAHVVAERLLREADNPTVRSDA